MMATTFACIMSYPIARYVGNINRITQGEVGLTTYPLINCPITMENHHAINGKTPYFNGHFQQQTVSLPEGPTDISTSWTMEFTELITIGPHLSRKPCRQDFGRLLHTSTYVYICLLYIRANQYDDYIFVCKYIYVKYTHVYHIDKYILFFLAAYQSISPYVEKWPTIQPLIAQWPFRHPSALYKK